MTPYELKHRETSNRFLFLFLALHIPAYVLFASFGLGHVGVALGGTVLLCLVPGLMVLSQPRSILTSSAIASSMMGMSMLLIFLGDGKIEYHFHVFSFLAVLCYQASAVTLIVAAATIAVHHVLGWWLVPSALFNYAAAFSDVLVHAGFVVVETIVCVMIARQMAYTIQIRGMLEERVSRSADEVAQGATEVARFVETFASSATEQASTVEDIAGITRDMEAKIQTTIHAHQKAGVQIGTAVDQISSTYQKLARVNTQMQTVSSTSRRISGIVSLMMDIARQTNILAVNASIEASRSGELGGGFGVIADQVRALAVKTAEASTEIDGLITSSLGQVESSAGAVEEIASQFASLSQVTVQMRKILDDNHEIGRTQASSIARISESMRHIAGEATNFATMAEQSTETSNHLNGLATDLKATLEAIH